MPISGLGNQQDLLRRLGRPKEGLGEIPTGANAQQLKNLLDANWAAVERGRPPTISKPEASWLVALAAHPGADASVKDAILAKVDGVKVSDAAKSLGFDAFLDQLRGAGTATPTPSTGTPSTGTPSTGGDGMDTRPGTSTGTDVTGLPTTPGAGGGNVIDVIAGGGGTTGPAAATKTNPLTFDGDLSFGGPFRISDDALAGAYRGVSHESFGTTQVELPNGQSRVANDMVYDLGDGKVGMHLIPVSDHGSVTDADGTTKKGHEVMDSFLREKMGLGKDDPIFTLIAYVHPEEHKGDLKALGTQMVKTEMGSTHMGAYVGEGRTTNAPGSYHNNKWGVKGYPANVQVVSLQGVDQATLNKNGVMADAILNKDVQFPPDYKNDKFRTIDLNTTLMFYRDWIRNEPYLKNDESWRTYCAEHKTIVTNVMLNLPHNEKSFMEVFGNDEGKKLWGEFKSKFQEVNGRAFTAADETSFEPLWKKEGLTADQIKPFATKADYDAYDAARHAGTLDSFAGQKPLEPGKGMAWAPETTADLMNDFLQTYVPVKEVGGAVAAAALLGFKDTITDRMGIDDMTFLGLAVPAINKFMIADAMVRAEDPGYMKQATGELYAAFGGNVADLMAGNPNAQIMGLVQQCLQGVKAQLGDIITDDRRPADAGARREMADAWMQKAIQPDLDRARKQAVADPAKTQFYSPPAVSHRVSVGMHESSKFVDIKTVCTAVDSAEIVVDD